MSRGTPESIQLCRDLKARRRAARRLVRDTLDAHGGNLTHTAAALGVSKQSLRNHCADLIASSRKRIAAGRDAA